VIEPLRAYDPIAYNYIDVLKKKRNAVVLRRKGAESELVSVFYCFTKTTIIQRFTHSNLKSVSTASKAALNFYWQKPCEKN